MNLALSLRYTAKRSPNAVAVIDGDLALSYEELLKRVSHLAGGLAGLGVGTGDTVAVALKNRHHAVETFWACAWLGARFVPLSWRIAPEDVAYCVTDSGANVVLYESASEIHAEASTGDGRTLVGVGDAATDNQPGYEELLAGPAVDGAFDLADSKSAIMLYTSGTTGRPKGVPRSHRADRAAGISQTLQHGYRVGERTLGVMPLYHTMGIHSMVAMTLMGGCYVCQPDWGPGEALDLIDRHRLSSLYLAPTLFHDLVHSPGVDEMDLGSVRALGYAGAAMTGALVERCIAVFDPEVFVNHYGSTEVYTYTIGADQASKPGCAGRPSLNALLRIVTPEPDATPDDVVPAGEVGEIICHLSSEEAFAGYWNRPDADAKSIRDGWYFTGDLGHLDAAGDLWIAGRSDDMIISGGENIHPLEVEDVLSRAPGVREVAVIGVADERLGEHVCACVVSDPGTTDESLDSFCLASDSLASFKRPREYRFVESLPKSPSGKVLRRLLRGNGNQ